LDDSELIEMMKEVLIQEGKPCPLSSETEGEKEREIW
jgi:hypothetical protein